MEGDSPSTKLQLIYVSLNENTVVWAAECQVTFSLRVIVTLKNDFFFLPEFISSLKVFSSGKKVPKEMGKQSQPNFKISLYHHSYRYSQNPLSPSISFPFLYFPCFLPEFVSNNSVKKPLGNKNSSISFGNIYV